IDRKSHDPRASVAPFVLLEPRPALRTIALARARFFEVLLVHAAHRMGRAELSLAEVPGGPERRFTRMQQQRAQPHQDQAEERSAEQGAEHGLCRNHIFFLNRPHIDRYSNAFSSRRSPRATSSTWRARNAQNNTVVPPTNASPARSSG